MEGPQFSTRAESLLHKSFNAEVIGMTNLPEAKLAREAELPYASLCFVTDYDAWHDTEEAVTVDAVLAVLRQNVNLAQRLLRNVERWPDPSQSPASSALSKATSATPLVRTGARTARPLIASIAGAACEGRLVAPARSRRVRELRRGGPFLPCDITTRACQLGVSRHGRDPRPGERPAPAGARISREQLAAERARSRARVTTATLSRRAPTSRPSALSCSACCQRRLSSRPTTPTSSRCGHHRRLLLARFQGRR
jgi:hypothetical protein